MNSQRRLGRGLEALLGRTSTDGASVGTVGQVSTSSPAAAARLFLHSPEEVEQAASSVPASEVTVGLIDANPWQPRSVVVEADIVELSESLREHGLVQP
ncbi:MAG: ParB N-terminal domain-containing protein, partial [Planctomycetaceae bacterium]